MPVLENKKLIDVLTEQGKVKKEDAVKYQNLSNFEVENKLKAENIVSEKDIAYAYALLNKLPFVALGSITIPKNVLEIVPENFAKAYKIIAYSLTEKTDGTKNILKMAIAEPSKITGNLEEVIHRLEDRKGIKIDLAITTASDFEKATGHYSPGETNENVISIKPEAPTQATLARHTTVNLDTIAIPFDVISKFPQDIAEKYQMVVFEAPTPAKIKVAVVDPDDKKVTDILSFIKEKNNIEIEVFKVTPSEIQRAIKFYDKHYYEQAIKEPAVDKNKEQPKELKQDIPIESSSDIPKMSLEDRREQEKIEQPDVELPKKEEQEKIEFDYASHRQPSSITQEKHEDDVPEIKEKTPKPLEQGETPAEKPIDQVPEVIGPQKATQVPVAQENDLDKFLNESVKDVDKLSKIAETGHVPKIVAASIILAVSKKASDIHIEPGEKNVRIRFRVDGLLHDIIKLPISFHPAIISRIKILSKLKIDETRIPQDGRFDVIAVGHAIDLRISTLPTVHGEKIAMRLLDKSAHLYTLEELGVTGRGLKVLLENMNKPYGVILSTGPTGSGKTTTLYAILTRISNASVNIITLEDPVEYEMAGLNQCQIKPKIGFTFANGLRSVLRQDPNIIMVGEIRDSETAALSTHAALTGHLVLSTLHTNDAAGALPRLTDMGVEPFFITSLINAIIGQRLVRKLCQKCKRKAHIPSPILKQIEEELARFNLPKPYNFFEGAGCSDCELGYSGRIGIFEVLTMSPRIEELVLTKKPASEIKREAVKDGMVTMKQDGLLKALKGQTTVNEVLRVITV